MEEAEEQNVCVKFIKVEIDENTICNNGNQNDLNKVFMTNESDSKVISSGVEVPNIAECIIKEEKYDEEYKLVDEIEVKDETLENVCDIEDNNSETAVSDRYLLSVPEPKPTRNNFTCNLPIPVSGNKDWNTKKHLKYKCDVCRRIIDRTSLLERHINAVHNKIKYMCGTCNKTYTRMGNLKKHINSTHRKIKYKCDVCEKKFSQTGTLKNHIHTVHWGTKIYKCDVCQRKFTHSNSLKYHVNAIHSGIKYECDKCHKKFTHAFKLKIHVNSVHRGIKYECVVCQKKYTYIETLKNHINSVHKRIKYE